jgi:hypothetical protein
MMASSALSAHYYTLLLLAFLLLNMGSCSTVAEQQHEMPTDQATAHPNYLEAPNATQHSQLDESTQVEEGEPIEPPCLPYGLGNALAWSGNGQQLAYIDNDSYANTIDDLPPLLWTLS